ncbi:MAG: hypothetical protein NVSMB66_6120 [Candidatus Doudnabacteria bacterium]
MAEPKATSGGWTNQETSTTWTPAKDRFGNNVNPRKGDPMFNSPQWAETIKSLYSRSRAANQDGLNQNDLFTKGRSVGSLGLETNYGDYNNFKGYTLPDTPEIRGVLQGLPGYDSGSKLAPITQTSPEVIQAQLEQGRQAQSGSIPGATQPQTNTPSQGTSPARANLASAYKGNSIVDYLKQSGQSTDFNSRAKLARSLKINNYRGSAEQNLKMLSLLRDGTPASSGQAGTPPQGAGLPTQIAGTTTQSTDQTVGQTTQPDQTNLPPQTQAPATSQTPDTSSETGRQQYARLLQESGLSQAQALDATFQKQIADTQNQISQLEANLPKELSGQGITQAGMQRRLGAEEAPLYKRLAELSTSESAAQGGISAARQRLADGLAANSYQTPQEQAAATLALKTQEGDVANRQALALAEQEKAAGVGSYYKAPTYEAATKYHPGQWVDPMTGKVTTAGGGSSKGTGGGGTTSASKTTQLGATGSSVIDPSQKGYTTKIVVGGFTQASIDKAAIRYATEGVFPSLGTSSKGEVKLLKDAIANRASELDADGNISSHKSELKSLSDSLVQQTTGLSTVKRSLQNADKGFQQLIDAFKNSGLNLSNSQYKNKWVNDFKKNISGGDVFAFDAGLQEVANEYAAVFSRGGQTTESVRSRAQEIANGNISFTDLQKVQKELQTQGKIVQQGYQDAVDGIKDQMNNIIPTGKSSNSTSNEFSVTTPDGQSHSFKSQKDMDAFNKAIKQATGK